MVATKMRQMKSAPFDSSLLEKLRRDTPATRDIAHFNNAGASLMPDPVFEATAHYFEAERMQGGYATQLLHKAQHDAFHATFAQLLDADAEEIAYAHSATHAWNLAFHSLNLSEGDEIVSHASDFVSNHLSYLQAQKRRGVVLRLAPSDASGAVDPEGLARLINRRTRLISLAHVPAQGGLTNPAEEIGRIARANSISYLLDACQSVGQMPVSVSRIGCDFLTGTGRKFLRGPRGTGFLYVSRRMSEQIEPPFVDMTSAIWRDTRAYDLAPGARRFESYEINFAGRIGLTVAASYALELGLDRIEARIAHLSGYLRAALQEIPGVSLHDLGTRLNGIVSFTKSGTTPEALVAHLADHRVNISAVPAHLARLALGARGVDGFARASVHYFNTEAEIARLCAAVRSG